MNSPCTMYCIVTTYYIDRQKRRIYGKSKKMLQSSLLNSSLKSKHQIPEAWLHVTAADLYMLMAENSEMENIYFISPCQYDKAV